MVTEETKEQITSHVKRLQHRYRENLIKKYNIELFKDIEGYEGLYQISSHGRVWSIQSQIFLAQAEDILGYKIVSLCSNNKKTTRTVHQLVLEAFDRHKNNREVCRHIDNNKLNNKLDNLKWGTQKENIQDGIIAGTIKVTGSENGNSKLLEFQVLEIREKYFSNKYTQKQLAIEYNVSKRLIWNIINRTAWKHI